VTAGERERKRLDNWPGHILENFVYTLKNFGLGEGGSDCQGERKGEAREWPNHVLENFVHTL